MPANNIIANGIHAMFINALMRRPLDSQIVLFHSGHRCWDCQHRVLGRLPQLLVRGGGLKLPTLYSQGREHSLHGPLSWADTWQVILAWKLEQACRGIPRTRCPFASIIGRLDGIARILGWVTLSGKAVPAFLKRRRAASGDVADGHHLWEMRASNHSR